VEELFLQVVKNLKEYKMKKTYMIELKKRFIVDAVTYAEVTAETSEEALEQVKSNPNEFFGGHLSMDETFIQTAIADLKDGQAISVSELKVSSLGRSSQYHTVDECELCRSVFKENESKK
jgi:hypothetical protein